MEIKRNIFESSGKMTKEYGPIGVPVTLAQTNPNTFVGREDMNASVQHAPIPRIGDQK